VTVRDRIVLAVVATAAVLAGFWFLILSPKREDGRELDGQIAAAQTRLESARSLLANAEAAKERYQRDYATVARLGKAVPVDDDVPSLVYQLENTAKRHGIDFRAIKVDESPTPGGTSSTPSQSGGPSGSDSSSGSGDSGSSGDSGGNDTAQASTAGSQLPPGSVVGPAGFPTMPFAFTFDGSFFNMSKFVRALDLLTTIRPDQSIAVRGRLLTIDGIGLKASRKGFPRVEATIAATAYLLPADEGLTGGATPAGPAAGPSDAPSTAQTFRSKR
jgi:type II secretory pathway pseudopilin PulG